MKQIAKMAGVSLGTVSNVINNSARVREPLRSRVLEAVEAAQYRPSALAQGLRRDKTKMIGMIIPDVTNPFFTAVVRGAEDLAFENGYRLVLCNTDNNHAKELEHLSQLRTYLPAGLILIPSHFSELSDQAEAFRRSGTTVICLDRTPRQWEGDTVTVANEEGSFVATKHLIQLGHRKIAMITGPLHLTNVQQRLAGFERALKQARVRIRANFVCESNFERLGGYSKGLELLRPEERPTAIFAQNDLMAMGVLLAAREIGLQCPRDVAVIGFDDLDVTTLIDPPLASVHQPGYRLGQTGVQLLLDRVNGSRGAAQHLTLETELRVRGSVGGPNLQRKVRLSKVKA